LSRTGTRTWPRTGDRGRNGGRLAAEDWRQKNKCGPGQPPGPHCFCEILFAPDPRTRHGGEQPSSPALRRVRAMMLLVRLSLAKRTSRTNLQHCDGTSGQSCRVWRTLEEAATPGQPVRAEARVWRNPPDNSPSRIIRNRWLCRNALAGRAGISLECGHCALSLARHQEKTGAPLCRNCECQKFFVESNGKRDSNPS
jgi:hypothetical protein